MKNNLIEELSNDFKNKVDFRTLSMKASDSKLEFDFVPKLKPKRSYVQPSPIFLNPLSKLHRKRNLTYFIEDSLKIKKNLKPEYNSAEINESLHFSDSTDESGLQRNRKGINISIKDCEQEISDSESSVNDDIKTCPFKKSKILLFKKFDNCAVIDEKGISEKKERNSILKFLENKRRNSINPENFNDIE